MSVIWGEAVEGIKKYSTQPTKCPPHYTIISAINRHLGGGVII